MWSNAWSIKKPCRRCNCSSWASWMYVGKKLVMRFVDLSPSWSNPMRFRCLTPAPWRWQFVRSQRGPERFGPNRHYLCTFQVLKALKRSSALASMLGWGDIKLVDPSRATASQVNKLIAVLQPPWTQPFQAWGVYNKLHCSAPLFPGSSQSMMSLQTS